MARLKKLLAGARQHLHDGEWIEASVTGRYTYESDSGRWKGGHFGALIATDRRIVFYSNRLFGFRFDSHPYPEITGIACGRFLWARWIQITTVRTTCSLHSASREAEAFTSLVRARIG